MDADFYVNEIERRMPDEESLRAIEQEIADDRQLDEQDRTRLLGRVGGYLHNLNPTDGIA